MITDDNFRSLVAGVEEGRVAYANVRKVIFLLVSTGAAEIVLFLLALAANVPLPLLAVQLLWLNLVTNGIQDVALAFEPAEGDELSRPPRAPNERIFDRLMLERVLISALVIGSIAFGVYLWLLDRGYSVEAARNSVRGGDAAASIAALAGAYGAARGWRWAGVLGVITGGLILSFYSVIGGWTIAYAIDPRRSYEALLASPARMIAYHALFLALVAAIVARGVGRG